MLTNKPKQGSGPDFPEDFRAACLIHGLSHESVLQHFIDHTMICASFNPPEKAYDTFPAAVIHQYVETFEPSLRRLRSPLKLRENLRAIRQIAGIAGSESLDRNAKRNACQGIVESWQKAVVRGGRQSQPLRWKGNLRLRLSRDFMLLCELFQLDPKEILYFFASRISLPRARAQADSNFDVESNPAMAFFLAVAKGHTGIRSRHKETANPDISLGYIEKLQELDLQLLFNRDISMREQVYRRLFRNWHEALTQSNNPLHEKEHLY